MGDKSDIISKRIKVHEGSFVSIFARNCEIRRIDSSLADEFLSQYHSLGSTGSRYRYGLFVGRQSNSPLPEGSLVAVSTFSQARKWDKILADGTPAEIRSYEWIRYASIAEVRVVGGMSKTLKQFIKEVKPDDIMTYCLDEKWKSATSDAAPAGDVYRKLGFFEETPLKFRLKLTDYK